MSDQPEEVLVTFDFLCFDAEDRREGDAERVSAVSPTHACQEYVASLESANNEISRRPYIIAVRPMFREGLNWDLYKITPKVSIEYPVSQPTPAEIAIVNGLQTKPALPPLQMRPQQHRAPDGHAISKEAEQFALSPMPPGYVDPNDTLGLN